MSFSMQPAGPHDAAIISAILTEAARWLEQAGKPLWRTEELTVEKVLPDIGRYFIAEVNGKTAGTLKFQIKDRIVWPDFADDDSAYLHRVTVRQSFAGRGISRLMLLHGPQITPDHLAKNICAWIATPDVLVPDSEASMKILVLSITAIESWGHIKLQDTNTRFDVGPAR